MNLLLIFLLAVIPISVNETREHVDLVEYNTFHDANGKPAYEQVVFYEWNPALSRYHVRAWALVDDRDWVDRRPTKRHSDGLWITHWQDRDANLLRVITATHYRRSWTQIDPERANKKLLDESERHGLVKRLPPQPIPDDTPMQEVYP